jgi:hypothetical protein
MGMQSQNIVRNLSIFLVVLIVVGYTIFNFRVFIAGPQIIFKSPANGSLAEKNLVEISGVAKNISSISMNDRQIFVNEFGDFKENILLHPGYNVVTVKASDKFNRKAENKLEIVYNGQAITATENVLLDENNIDSSTSTENLSGSSSTSTKNKSTEDRE